MPRVQFCGRIGEEFTLRLSYGIAILLKHVPGHCTWKWKLNFWFHTVSILCLKSLLVSDQVRRCFGLLFISNLGACDLLFLSKGRSVSLTSQLFQRKCVLLSLDNIYKLYYEFCQQDAGTNLSDQVRRWFGVLFTSNLEVCDLVFPSNWKSISSTSQLYVLNVYPLIFENINKL